MNVKLVPVSNGFIMRVLGGRYKDEFVAQMEGRFTADPLWAKLFTTESDAETYAKKHNITIK